MWRGGREVPLSPTEFNLLRYLMVNAGRVLSKAQILDHVWSYDFDGDANIVESYVSYLRRKLDDGAEPLIHTVRGVGYVLRPPRAPEGGRVRPGLAPTPLWLRLISAMLCLVALGLTLTGLFGARLLRGYLVDRVDEQLDEGVRLIGGPLAGTPRRAVGCPASSTSRSSTPRAPSSGSVPVGAHQLASPTSRT